MTTIYTKPQIDAMAVKIGGEIKKNKTAIAAIKPASTTVAGIVQLNNTVSSTSITQAATANAVKLANDKAAAAIPSAQKGAVNGIASLGSDGKVTPTQLPTAPVLGTAATKDIGTATGQVMLVGAGGILGSGLDVNLAPEAMLTQLRATGSTVFRNISASSAVHKSFGVGFFASTNGTATGYTVSPFGEGITFFSDRNGNQNTYNLWTDKNTPSSNFEVASLQAGIGAPKLAYKKLTGASPSGSTRLDVAHGLDGSKILSVSVLIESAGVRYPSDHSASGYFFRYEVGDANITVYHASGNNLNAKPMTIFITYEV